VTWINRRMNRSEEGWVVITAIVLMTIMLGVGLAIFSTADTQSRQSSQERVRESAFNLAEGLLQAESVVLQNNWPSDVPCAANSTSCGYPVPDACTKTGPTVVGNANQCPDASRIVGATGTFSNVDQALTGTGARGVNWRIQIRDDIGVCSRTVPQASAFYDSCQIPTYYTGLCPPPNQNDATKCWPAVSTAKYSTNPAQAPGSNLPICKDANNVSVVCSWDANGNKQLWVRIDATVGGKTRSLVALLRLENFPVVLNSKDAVNGGVVSFSNNGNKHIVDTNGSQVVTRCTPTTGGNPTAGTSLKTALATDILVPNSLFVAVLPDNATTQAFKKDDVVALGADTNLSSNYELLTLASNPVLNGAGLRVFTFTTRIQNLHKAIDGTNKLELAPSTANNCQTWTSPPAPGVNGADKHQLDNYWNYKSDPNYPNFLSTASYNGVVAALKPWTTCPPDDYWDGNNVYIKSLPAGTQCTIPNGTFNSAADPHFIIVENELPINAGTGDGTCNATPPLKLSGNTVYYGVIYMVNKQKCGFNQTILQIQAGGQIQGGVAIDGNAKVDIGNASNSSQCTVSGGSGTDTYCPTIKFDPVAFGSVAASGAAGLVQNTWRELAPGQ
jgi:Tfp pilus assembly protein PilX